MQQKDQIRSFLAKIAITQPIMVQIPKFWCLNPSTIICLSCENIHLVKRTINNELTGEKPLKPLILGPIFALKTLFCLITLNEGQKAI